MFCNQWVVGSNPIAGSIKQGFRIARPKPFFFFGFRVGVRAIIASIGRPMITDENAAEAGDEPNRRAGLASALGMDGKKGEQGHAQDRQPMQFAADRFMVCSLECAGP